eukprot:m.289388 g.289388  ORF g.289388 m.289388 type:complete len:156 (+) comp12126_c0_seq1:296-763(+)
MSDAAPRETPPPYQAPQGGYQQQPMSYQQQPPPVSYQQQAPQQQQQQKQQGQYYNFQGAPQANGYTPGSYQQSQIVYNIVRWDRQPMMHVCQFCGFQGPTVVEFETSGGTHLIAGGICLLGCWLCCCFPYFMEDCKDAVHLCAQCRAIVGRRALI